MLKIGDDEMMMMEEVRWVHLQYYQQFRIIYRIPSTSPYPGCKECKPREGQQTLSLSCSPSYFQHLARQVFNYNELDERRIDGGWMDRQMGRRKKGR